MFKLEQLVLGSPEAGAISSW